MIAIALLLVVLVPSTQLIETTVQQSIQTRNRVAALEMAEQGLEQISSDSITTLEAYLNTNWNLNTETIAGVSYTVTGYLTWLGVGSNPDLCTAGSPPQVMGATATVTWEKNYKVAESEVINPPYGLAVFYLATGLTQGQSGITTLTATNPQTIAQGATLTIGADTADSQTVTVSAADNNSTTIDVTNSSGQPVTALFNFPAVTTPVALPGDGYLAVQVDGAGTGPPADVEDVAVNVTPVTPAGPVQTLYPDNTGCVYEQELPGTYDISLGTGTVSPPPEPFVDLGEDLTPLAPPSDWPTNVTTAQVVTANDPTPSVWNYDESDLTSFVPAGTLPLASGTPVSVYSSQIPGTHTVTVIPAGSSATTAYLYPFSSAYSVWYGDCAGENPGNVNPANVNALQAGEGGTSLLSLGGLDDLAYEVTKPVVAGAPLAGATAVATMVNDDPACANDAVIPVTTSSVAGSVGISQTGVVVDSEGPVGCSLAHNPVPCTGVQATDDGKQVVATGLPSNAYVYSSNGITFTLSSSPVASVPITAPTVSSFYVVGETYSVKVIDPAQPTHPTTATLMVNPNGVVKWGTPNTFSQYPLTGTAVTIPVA
jgi:hypothetical protein